MVTKIQALTHDRFVHVNAKTKRGKQIRVKANGKCKTWKTRPGEFRLPVRYDWYTFGYITHENANEWVVEGHEGLTDEQSAVKTDEYIDTHH